MLGGGPNGATGDTAAGERDQTFPVVVGGACHAD